MVTPSFYFKHVPDLIHEEREERISIVKLATKSKKIYMFDIWKGEKKPLSSSCHYTIHVWQYIRS